MIYQDAWFENNPYVIRQPEQQQQQQQQMDPMQMLDMYQQLSGAGGTGGGATLGTASGGGMGATGLGSVMGSSLGGTAGAGSTAASGGMGSMGLGSIMGGGSGAMGGLGSSAVQGSSLGGSVLGGGGGAAAGGGSSGAGAALASNPVGWIVAAALAQNVAHNKGVSSWQAGLKGQAGMNIGDYYMKDKWGMEEDDPLYDIAGVLGWGSGGGVFNPGYLSKKIFGKVD